MNTREIGNTIQKRRQALQLTQEDLAEMAGITSRTINKIETGVANPAIETLQKISAVLGLEIDLSIKQVDQ